MECLKHKLSRVQCKLRRKENACISRETRCDVAEVNIGKTNVIIMVSGEP